MNERITSNRFVSWKRQLADFTASLAAETSRSNRLFGRHRNVGLVIDSKFLVGYHALDEEERHRLSDALRVASIQEVILFCLVPPDPLRTRRAIQHHELQFQAICESLKSNVKIQKVTMVIQNMPSNSMHRIALMTLTQIKQFTIIGNFGAPERMDLGIGDFLSSLGQRESKFMLELHIAPPLFSVVLPRLATMAALCDVTIAPFKSMFTAAPPTFSALAFSSFYSPLPADEDTPHLPASAMRAICDLLLVEKSFMIRLRSINAPSATSNRLLCNHLARASVYGFGIDRCCLGDIEAVGDAITHSSIRKVSFNQADFRLMGSLSARLAAMPFLVAITCTARSGNENARALIELTRSAAHCQRLAYMNLKTDKPSADLDDAIANCIQFNRRLAHMTIACSPVAASAPKHTFPLMLASLDTNYNIQHLALNEGMSSPELSPWDPTFVQAVKAYTELNRAGRGYMATNMYNKRKGIEVLTKVRENVHCVYQHLRKNPWFCEEHNCAIPEMKPVAGRKRKAKVALEGMRKSARLQKMQKK